jgi:hypothetical protein
LASSQRKAQNTIATIESTVGSHPGACDDPVDDPAGRGSSVLLSRFFFDIDPPSGAAAYSASFA